MKKRISQADAERKARIAAAGSSNSFAQELATIQSTFEIVSWAYDSSSSDCDTSAASFDGGGSADCGSNE